MRIHGPVLPPAATEACRRIAEAGGRPRVVGGAVRDALLGRTTKDLDFEIFGIDLLTLERLLRQVGRVDRVGRSFGVLKLRADGAEHDFSLPRRDSRTGIHHRDFEVSVDPFLSEAEAAARRDFTVNAISWDPVSHVLVDPLGGIDDLARRTLRHCGPTFADDPLRVLRAFQLAGRFDFTLHPDTAALSRSIAGAFGTIATERVWMEWAKWAGRSTSPARGLAVLAESGWLSHFPELAALPGTPQDPEWHPEGDVWTHTLHCCDALVRLPGWREAGEEHRQILLLAVLGHDFGKPSTTRREDRGGRERWVSPGHEPAGGPLVDAFLVRLGSPAAFAGRVRPLVENHLFTYAIPRGEISASAVRRLARRLAPSTVADLLLVMRADHLGRPPLVKPETEERLAALADAAAALAVADAAPRPILLGRHLIGRGLRPGPRFGLLLDAAFEAQLEGAFADEPGALAWLDLHLAAEPPPA